MMRPSHRVFGVVYKVPCKLVPATSLTFPLTLSSLRGSAPATLASWLFPEMPRVVSPQGLCTCCSLCLAHFSSRFPCGSLPHFLNIYAQVPPSQRRPPDHCVHAHTHKGQMLPFPPHPASHTLPCFPHSSYCHWTYNILTFLFVYFISLPLDQGLILLCSLLYLQHVERTYHKLDVRLIFF